MKPYGKVLTKNMYKHKIQLKHLQKLMKALKYDIEYTVYLYGPDFTDFSCSVIYFFNYYYFVKNIYDVKRINSCTEV